MLLSAAYRAAKSWSYLQVYQRGGTGVLNLSLQHIALLSQVEGYCQVYQRAGLVEEIYTSAAYCPAKADWVLSCLPVNGHE